jgi:hypothetical protein
MLAAPLFLPATPFPCFRVCYELAALWQQHRVLPRRVRSSNASARWVLQRARGSATIHTKQQLVVPHGCILCQRLEGKVNACPSRGVHRLLKAVTCMNDVPLSQVLCHPGTWSNATGLSAPCTQLCTPGYVCAAGSTSPAPRPCGSFEVYCPKGTGEPLPVPAGFYSWGGLDDGTTRVGISPCPAPSDNGGVGVYCPLGLGRMLPCVGGYFGDASQLNVPTCSGPCVPGHFCPPGSSSPTMSPCGSAAVYVDKSDAVCPALIVRQCCRFLCRAPRHVIGSLAGLFLTPRYPRDLGMLCAPQSGTALLSAQHPFPFPTATSLPRRPMIPPSEIKPCCAHLAATAWLACGTCARLAGSMRRPA